MKWYPMNRKAFLAAIAFLGVLALFSLSAPSPFSLPLVSPAYAAPQPAPRQQQDSAPEFPSTETGVRTVDENTDPYEEIGDPVAATDPDDDKLTYSLENADTSHFGIDRNTGQLLTGAPLDYESKSSYTVTVTATDLSDLSDSIQVTINVNNVDEEGKVTLSWRPAGESGIVFEATLNEPDEVDGTPTWQWSSANSQNGSYNNISGTTSATYTPAADANHKYLQATATYTDAHASGRTARATLQVELPSYLNGYTLNFNPNTSGGYSCLDGNSADICVRVSRNVTPGDDIYYPASPSYKAENADNLIQNRYPSRGTISYSLGGTDASYFDIGPSNGDLLPKPKPRWDVHLLSVGSRAGSLAGMFRPLTAGQSGSAVSLRLSG